MDTHTHEPDTTTAPGSAADIADVDADRLGAWLADVSAWIDAAPANAARDREAATWGRIAKVAEESGEAIAAYIGATGQNPRKGHSHSLGDVHAELLDVAITALAAVEHLSGNTGASVHELIAHVARRRQRLLAILAADTTGTAVAAVVSR